MSNTPTLRRPRGKVSMSEAAFLLLAESDEPMHYRTLTKAALRKKLILSAGRTPEQSLRSQLAMEIQRKKAKSRFKAKGEGVYTLSRFGKRLAETPGAEAASAGAPAGEAPQRTRKARSGADRSLKRSLTPAP